MDEDGSESLPPIINTSTKKLPTQDEQQMAMFGFDGEEPASSIADAQFSFLSDLRLPQQIIDEALCIGANHTNSRLTICTHFMKDKADMFTKRTIRPHEPVTHVDTAAEALAVSITEKARVDMAYMSELSGITPEVMEEELSGVIFRDVNCAEDPKDIMEAQKDMGRYPPGAR